MLAIAMLLFSGTAMSADWEPADKWLLGGALGLIAVDWAQTRKLTYTTTTYATPACSDPETRNHPLAGPCPSEQRRPLTEYNPLLGHQPSNAEINRYFMVALAGTAALSFALPKTYRRVFLWSVVAVESFVVINNDRIGLKVIY